MNIYQEKDVEAVAGVVKVPSTDTATIDEAAVPTAEFGVGDTWYARAQRLAGNFGVEQRGIERVPSNERLAAGLSQIGTLVSLSALRSSTAPS